MPTHHLLLFLLCLSFLHTSLSDDASSTSFVYVTCSSHPHKLPLAFPSNLNPLLTSLANAASSSTFSSSFSFLYGLFQCRADLPQPDCTACVRAAIDRLPILCPTSSSAALQLRGCLLRYDTHDFINRPDESLQYKKCMQIGGDDPSLREMRDAVLSGLAAEEGMYMEKRIGYVDGVAQCVGDQSLGECRSCVAEAVKTARAECGEAAAYGEVYLGKCYVEYSPWRFHLSEDSMAAAGRGWWWRLAVAVVAVLAC